MKKAVREDSLLWLSDSEEFLYQVFFDIGSDDAELSGNIRCSCPDLCLSGNIVEVDPLIILTCYDTLGS